VSKHACSRGSIQYMLPPLGGLGDTPSSKLSPSLLSSGASMGSSTSTQFPASPTPVVAAWRGRDMVGKIGWPLDSSFLGQISVGVQDEIAIKPKKRLSTMVNLPGMVVFYPSQFLGRRSRSSTRVTDASTDHGPAISVTPLSTVINRPACLIGLGQPRTFHASDKSRRVTRAVTGSNGDPTAPGFLTPTLSLEPMISHDSTAAPFTFLRFSYSVT
jgi:hypothetical protein